MNSMATIYDQLYRLGCGRLRYGGMPNKVQHEWGLSHITKSLQSPDSHSVLDLGCGPAWLLWGLKKRGYRDLVGVDWARSLAWKSRIGSVVVGDITTIDLRRTFDCIVCHDVLEHVPQDQLPSLFQNILRHLAPDGYVSLTVADHSDKWCGVELHITRKPVELWYAEILKWFHVIEHQYNDKRTLGMFWCKRKPEGPP